MTVKIWTCGFSRGAAVSNLVAGELTRNSDNLGLEKENIYAYNFATPQGVDTTYAVNKDVHTGYENIINIVNPSDVVPSIPMSVWGYDRYGTTYFFNYNDNNVFYQELDENYHEITEGGGYTPIDLSRSVAYFDLRLADIFGGKSDYANIHSDYLTTIIEIMFHENDGNLFGIIFSLPEKISDIYETDGGVEAVSRATSDPLVDSGATLIRQYGQLTIDRIMNDENVKADVAVLSLVLITGLDLDLDDPNVPENTLKCINLVLSSLDVGKDKILKWMFGDIKVFEDVSIQSPERVLINLCIDQGIQLIKNIIEIDVSNSLVEGCLAIGFMNGYDSKTSISEVERVVLFINSLVSLSENDYSLAPILKQHSPELYMAWLNSDKSINTLYTTEHVDLSLLMNGMAELDLVADGDGLVLGSSKLPRNIDITIRAIEENGSTFIGWYDEAGDLYSTDATTSVKLKDDMRLTAKFQSGYSITYNLAGGVNHPDNPVTYDSSDADIILKDPTKEGYVFAGWTWSYQPNPTKDVVIKSGSSGNKKFNANWKRIEDLIDGNADIPEWEIYRVQIPDAGSGEYVEITPINIEIDTVVLENIPAKVTPKRLYEITGSANPPKGKKAKIYFYLLDSEIPDSVSYSDVAMYHYVNSNWEKLPTYYDGPSETGVMHTFHAETTGFSLFAIVFESPVDSDSISSSKNTGSGNYAEYLRSVTNGGYVDFGTSPVVKGVTLPEGVSSKVVLIAKSNTPAPKGKEAYGIFDINIDKYPTGEKAVISFTIPLADLQKKGFTEKDICLYHFDGEVWTKLPTTYKVDGDKALYEAETTDFSPFAIMYEKDGAVSAVVSETPVEPEQPNDEPVSDIPENPSSSESQEAESPAPVLGVMLGALGAAVLMRRK